MIREGNKIKDAIQVTYEINEKNNQAIFADWKEAGMPVEKTAKQEDRI